MADPELEFSPLGGHVTRDGISVQVCIYRLAEGGDGWTLEVVDPTGTSTLWDETFPTDAEAYAAFEAALADGILQFLAEPSATLH